MKDRKQSQVNLKNAYRPGSNKYRKVINRIEKDGVCPFCANQLKKYHKNPILINGRDWVVTKSMYPYKGTSIHLLFIHKKHIENSNELSKKAWVEFFKLINKVNRKSKIPGGAFFLRFGDTNYNGASVAHLHAHLISSNPKRKNYKPILARLG